MDITMTPSHEEDLDVVDPGTLDWRGMTDDEVYVLSVEGVPQAKVEIARRVHALAAAKSAPGRKFRRPGQQ